MKLTLEAFLESLRALPLANAYLVAFSGGRDSRVLLDLMTEAAPALGVPLAAVHVDHGLQARSRRWSEQCAGVCAQLGVPFRAVRLALRPAPGESPEAAAREARYRALAELLEPGAMLLTAHHRDDQAETVLLQLLRGAGVAGLAAMPPVAPFGAGLLGRPLLGFDAAEVEAWARRRGLQWLEDPSNRDTAFDRNYLRQRVLPLLRQRWPALGRTLARSARHCAEAQALVEAGAAADLAALDEAGDGTLAAAQLVELPRPRARAVLRAWIRNAGVQVPDAARLDRILDEVAGAAPERLPLVRWSGAEVRRYRGRLHLLLSPPRPLAGTLLAWDGVTPLALPEGTGRLSVEQTADGGIDPERWRQGRIEVRFGRPGERLRLAGEGCSRSFRQFCQQRAIPPWERERLPLVYLDGVLAAVADLALCRPFNTDGRPGVRLVWRRERRSRHCGAPAYSSPWLWE